MSKNKQSLPLRGKTPAISVVMPVYNSAKYLPLAIESILNQTYSDFEFIIIDDGSTDASWDIIRGYATKDKRIKIKKNVSNLGICRTLNEGLSQAKSDFIARMDSDDWSYPDRFGKQLAFMKSHPKVVICGGGIEVCDSNLKVKNSRYYPASDKKIREKILRINPFAHPAVLFRADAFHKTGGYNPDLSGVEDYDLYFRIGKYGKFANVAEKVLKLRTHPDSVSSRIISKQARLNLYVRIKAITEYGYVMSFIDKVYFFFNFIGIGLIPGFLKFKTYNFLRGFQK